MKKIPNKFFIVLMFFLTYTITGQTPGDVNNDMNIDIVDALLVAQYYVGLDPENFISAHADVNGIDSIDIVDALLIAQFYVGLITEFPGQTQTPIPGRNEDIFGITMIYSTQPGSLGWDSTHWADGQSRTLSNDIMSGNDPNDPTFWSEYRGSGTLFIDGNGMLRMGGSQPRIYINSYEEISEENPEMFFKNVEVTVYYMRIGNDGANWGGCIIGARSGPNGHSSWGDYCDATTYYARLRYDGKVDFYKELKHPDGTIGISQVFREGNPLPSNKWIGMKFCCYNINNNQQVKLEMYIDTSSNGTNGGNWEKAIEYIDDGTWTVPVNGCSYPENQIITQGGGVVFIRNTNAAEAHYKWFTVREINVP